MADAADLRITCPCCGALLSVHRETGVVQRVDPKRATSIADLAAEVKKLKSAEAEREGQFQRSLEAERSREQTSDRRFAELLKRARETERED